MAIMDMCSIPGFKRVPEAPQRSTSVPRRHAQPGASGGLVLRPS
jgi:hypothetical protein